INGTTVAYGSLGLTINGKSLELLVGTAGNSAVTTTLANNGITPVNKNATPYLDVGALITTLDPTGKFFSHDKIEGISVINGGTQVVIANDSDFGISGTSGPVNGPYTLLPKITTAGVQDDGEFLIVNLTHLPARTSTATVTISVHAPLKANDDSYGVGASKTL